MAEFKSKLLTKEEIANGTMAFYFEKPEGLSYVAGQHITLRLIDPPETDAEGNDRTFSLITIPSDNKIGIATRMRNTAFKRILKNSSDGLAVEIIDPRGSMILPKQISRPAAFLAGGIGITPFISMIRQAAKDQSSQKIFLFYSNRTVKDASFFEELQNLAKQNKNFVLIATMTQEDADNWQGEKGYITESMLKRHLGGDFENTVFYLAGPTGFVSGLSDMLLGAKVDSLFIKSEDYGEYR